MVGAAEFWSRAKRDIQSANRRVAVQAMTFEGDAVGLAVAEVLLASQASDRRVLVDGYTRVNVNDTNLSSVSARGDASLQAEVRATSRMFLTLANAGVAVRVTNPIGRFSLNYPSRNHKKLVVADNVAYLGGVNFSEHNFGWSDLMLRIDDASVADFLAGDFDRTFCGKSELKSFDAKGVHVIALDGRANWEGFAGVFSRIRTAQREIVVASPYLTAPFTDALGLAAKRGVKIKVLTPEPNNKPIVREALIWAARRHGFDVVLGPVMSHVKGMLIDRRDLILGSSNFDFVSLAAEEEFVVFVDDPKIVRDFEDRIISPALASALAAWPQTGPGGRVSDLALRVAAVAASAARGFPRMAVDWPT